MSSRGANDRAPMVAITGQASSDTLHKEAHQVVDIVRMFEPVTKWNTRVERVDAVPEIVRKAFRVAELEKPGPAPELRAFARGLLIPVAVTLTGINSDGQ